MTNKKLRNKVLVGLFLIASVPFGSYWAQASNVSGEAYDLNEVLVEDTRWQTEDDKYVRTGGNVNIITTEEIEKRHFSDVKEALLSVPGISVEDPGYHAQAYQESSYGSQTVRVNGDNRVLISISLT